MEQYPSSLGERLVGVEFRTERAIELAQQAVEGHSAILSKLETMDKKIDEMNSDIVRYKGIVGGIALALTGVGILVSFFKGWLFTKLGIPA